MDWRDKSAQGAAKLGVSRPAEANKQCAEFFISAFLLLIAIGGLAM
jgi:hypothetical protein